uniref:Uncharacterized protein n=1 Tax=Oryza glumipatula TaxID=40148 RepID=A0A0E0BSK6_9ORYZ
MERAHLSVSLPAGVPSRRFCRLTVVSSPEVAGIDASGVANGGGLRSLGAHWNLIAAWRGLGNSGNGKDSPAVVDNVGFTATARLGGGMLREGAWVSVAHRGERDWRWHSVTGVGEDDGDLPRLCTILKIS